MFSLMKTVAIYWQREKYCIELKEAIIIRVRYFDRAGMRPHVNNLLCNAVRVNVLVLIKIDSM